MIESTQPPQDQLIKSWNDCAAAYDRFIQKWPIFTEMADALIERIPADFHGTVLDIAGGTGLAAERVLKRFPQASLVLIEPAAAMRALSARRLGEHVELRAARGDQLDELGITADAAVCNASFHLMDEAQTLPAVASVLKHGANFATNLWGHSFDETAPLDDNTNWFTYVEQALSELDLAPQTRPVQAAPRLRSADTLRSIGRSCGLELTDMQIQTREIEVRFSIEFSVMRGALLNDIDRATRDRVIDRALTLCTGTENISWVELVFERR